MRGETGGGVPWENPGPFPSHRAAMSDLLRSEFALPSHANPAELADALEQAFGFLPQGRRRLERVYYDSFDGRLRRAGFGYAIEPDGDALAVWVAGPGGAWYEPVAVAAPPRFAQDLPSAPWRGPVAALLDCRALLPRPGIALMREMFVWEDAAGEALMRAELDIPALEAPPLPVRLRLVAVGCGHKRFRHTVGAVSGRFGLEPAPVGGRAEVSELSGVAGCRLDPAERADVAAKRILAAQWAAIRRNEAGVLDPIDTEFLHDFRVAVRRTRAALGQIKGVFPAAATLRYAQAFAELGRVTGEPRDLDVYLLDFERHREALPEAWHGELEPLRALLRERAAAAHARLNDYLKSPGYRSMARQWERFLHREPPARPTAPQAALPIRALAGRRIWKLYRRVVAEGLAIEPASPADRLHELRKTAKKLRYLLEFFRELYPPERIDPLIKALKGLQEHLGAYQDAQAQIGQLRDFAEALRATGAPTGTLLALGALLDRRYNHERRLREDFPDCFAGFAAAGRRRKFRRLFKPAAKPL